MSDKERLTIEDQLMISQGLPSNKERLKSEISLLYEWSRQFMVEEYDSNFSLMWKFLIHTLERIYTVTFDTKPAVFDETYFCLISLIKSLVERPKWFIGSKQCSSFLLLCGNVSYILKFRENKPKEAYHIISLMSDVCLCKNESCFTNGIYYFTIQAKILGSLGHYDLALKKLSKIEEITDLTENIKINHLKSKLLFDSGKFEEASTLMIQKTKDQIIDKKLRSSVFNTIGCCLAKLEKPALASLWFHKSYQDDDENCFSLWNLSLQYKAQKNFESEISVLRLLTEVSKKHVTGENSDASISKMEALYLFGFRSLQLKFYNFALDSYKQLENCLHDGDVSLNNWKIIACPGIVKIKLDMAYIYYHRNYLLESMNLCDLINDDFPETKEESKAGLLRNYIEGNSNYLDDPKNAYYGLSASLIKSLCLIKLGLKDDARDNLKKIISSMSLFNMKENISTKTPRVKKFKLDISLGSYEEETVDLSPIYELISLAYGNLGVLRVQKGHYQDALHYFEVSTLSWPQNVDTLFNYVLLLIKLEDKAKASKVWFEAKLSNLTLKNVLDKEFDPEDLSHTVEIEDLKKLNAFLG